MRIFGRGSGDRDSAQLRDVSSIVAQGAAPLPGVEYRVVGARLSQVVENRADGSKNITTLTWSNDLVTKLEQTNPVRTITYTYSGGVPTGFSTT